MKYKQLWYLHFLVLIFIWSNFISLQLVHSIKILHLFWNNYYYCIKIKTKVLTKFIEIFGTILIYKHSKRDFLTCVSFYFIIPYTTTRPHVINLEYCLYIQTSLSKIVPSTISTLIQSGRTAPISEQFVKWLVLCP